MAQIKKRVFGENVSERVLKLITGTAKLTKKWLNMDEFSRYDNDK